MLHVHSDLQCGVRYRNKISIVGVGRLACCIQVLPCMLAAVCVQRCLSCAAALVRTLVLDSGHLLQLFKPLTQLNCSCMARLLSLNLSQCASLSHLHASLCDKLTSLNLAGCTSLHELILLQSSDLTRVDLSDCVSLQKLQVADSGLTEVAALKQVDIHEGQRVVGAGPGVQVKAW